MVYMTQVLVGTRKDGEVVRWVEGVEGLSFAVVNFRMDQWANNSKIS